MVVGKAVLASEKPVPKGRSVACPLKINVPCDVSADWAQPSVAYVVIFFSMPTIPKHIFFIVTFPHFSLTIFFLSRLGRYSAQFQFRPADVVPLTAAPVAVVALK